jgi:RING-variant finger protein
MFNDDDDERECRLCYAAGDCEENRLFRPCECSGTQAYIHEQCLQRWRDSAVNTQYFYECAVCGYRYRLRRVSIYRLIVHWFSVCLFTLGAVAGAVLLLAYTLEWSGAITQTEHSIILTAALPTLDAIGVACLIIGFVMFFVGVFTDVRPLVPDIPPPPIDLRILLLVIAVIGLLYFILVVYEVVCRRCSRPILGSVGERVLEIKKRQ